MSERPITHCEHGIDRAYRCIDCIEAERDALRAWVQELEVENLALQNVLSSQQRAPSLEKLIADLRRTELQTVIVAALQHTKKTGLPFREPEKAGSAHLTESGRFQSDKYRWCAAGFVPIKTSDPMAQDLLRIYAERRAA